MGLEPSPAPAPKKMVWAGYIVSGLVAAALVMSAVGKLSNVQEVVDGFGKLGYEPSLALGLGILELVCTLVYLLPRTAVLGAILLTGYLGGATATHVRVGEPSFAPIILGVLVWLGLYLRDERLRLLVPLRSNSSSGRMSLVKKLMLGFAAVVVVFAVVVPLQPAKFRVVRSATIAALPVDVFAQVNDFHNWEAWSPWAKLDPDCKNTFDGPTSGTGALFTWSGNDKVGAGRMLVTESRPGELVKIKLDFIKPFESSCITEFKFTPQDKGTRVTWDMSGERDLVSKAFCLFMNMDKMVGGDFEKGLAQMKAVTEAGARK